MLKGRITGVKFFLLSLPCILLGIVLKPNLVGSPWDGILALLFLFSLPVMLIAAVRRSHDFGRSGWLALICLIPFAGWYLVFKSGNPGANKYGPSPISPSIPTNDESVSNLPNSLPRMSPKAFNILFPFRSKYRELRLCKLWWHRLAIVLFAVALSATLLMGIWTVVDDYGQKDIQLNRASGEYFDTTTQTGGALEVEVQHLAEKMLHGKSVSTSECGRADRSTSTD
jgi:uncharacterized membrane protein YhaH (DUF805 family)